MAVIRRHGKRDARFAHSEARTRRVGRARSARPVTFQMLANRFKRRRRGNARIATLGGHDEAKRPQAWFFPLRQHGAADGAVLLSRFALHGNSFGHFVRRFTRGASNTCDLHVPNPTPHPGTFELQHVGNSMTDWKRLDCRLIKVVLPRRDVRIAAMSGKLHINRTGPARPCSRKNLSPPSVTVTRKPSAVGRRAT
jgi:hypothetical protein